MVGVGAGFVPGLGEAWTQAEEFRIPSSVKPLRFSEPRSGTKWDLESKIKCMEDGGFGRLWLRGREGEIRLVFEMEPGTQEGSSPHWEPPQAPGAQRSWGGDLPQTLRGDPPS